MSKQPSNLDCHDPVDDRYDWSDKYRDLYRLAQQQEDKIEQLSQTHRQSLLNCQAENKRLAARLEKADALAEALDLWHKSAASGSSKLMGDAAAVLATSLAAYRDTEGETR